MSQNEKNVKLNQNYFITNDTSISNLNIITGIKEIYENISFLSKDSDIVSNILIIIKIIV